MEVLWDAVQSNGKLENKLTVTFCKQITGFNWNYSSQSGSAPRKKNASSCEIRPAVCPDQLGRLARVHPTEDSVPILDWGLLLGYSR